MPDPTAQVDVKSDTASPGRLLQHNTSPKTRRSPSNSDLLGNWCSSPASTKYGGGFDGVEAGALAVPHPVVAAMNGATVSILLRLKHAAMFEDFQVSMYNNCLQCWVAASLKSVSGSNSRHRLVSLI